MRLKNTILLILLFSSITVIIGCSNATVNGLLEAGSVYVVDRNVQKFIRQDDSSNTYTVLGTVTAPVSVLVNNAFLTNQTDSIVGADNTFSVSGNNITINKDLFVGDVIEIEINQFVQQYIDYNKIWKQDLENKLDDFYDAMNWDKPNPNLLKASQFFGF